LKRPEIFLLAGLSILAVMVYLIVSALTYRLGFPLDDAWIHQAYARSLALHGEWAFIPGRVSGGSTSPLWTLLLAAGHRLGLAPYGWTYMLGVLSLFLLSLVCERSARRISLAYRPRLPWVGILITLEYHLVWAAGSGMETLFHAFLVTAALSVLAGSRRYLLAGLLIVLSVWVRPDGITLLAPAFLAALLVETTWKDRLRAMGNLLLGFSMLFIPYLFLNLLLAGTPWPSTFYAKQAEYAELLQVNIFERFGRLLLQPLIGVGLSLSLGFILFLADAWKRRRWGLLAGMAWTFAFVALYAIRLPVIYQYGRYLIPAMPIFLTCGLLGLLTYIPRPVPRWLWTFDTAWRLLTVALLLLFYAIGAGAFAQDVAVIESEMVAVASWVSANVPSEALVAAHDIGALGYFGGHELVDMAGLVSPEVIPFIRDEARLAAYLDERGADYLVTFPDWYPLLTSGLQPLYESGGDFAPRQGQENMVVYPWGCR